MNEPRFPLRPDGSLRRQRSRRAFENEPSQGAWAYAHKRAAPDAIKVLKDQQPQQPSPRQRRSIPRKDEKPALRLPVFRLALMAVLFLVLLFSLSQKNSAENKLLSLRAQREAAAKKHEDSLRYYEGMRTKSGVAHLIDQYAKEFQVEPAMISAIIARESHYDPYAESRVGARGLMQLMEDTGRWVANKLGVKGYSYEHLFDADLNIRFGTWYLSYLSDHLRGDPVMVAAAYHAGMNNVNLWALKYADDERTLTVDQIPMQDTKDYVKKVMNAYALYYEMEQTR